MLRVMAAAANEGERSKKGKEQTDIFLQLVTHLFGFPKLLNHHVVDVLHGKSLQADFNQFRAWNENRIWL